MAEQETIKLEFNGLSVSAPKGVTILRAAELNGVYIPTLCYHKDLSPFGGCRMCLVEIDGVRGYPLACSTQATDGMKVKTDTVAIQEMRKEILGLILSEHPASCLICSESQECRKSMKTVRKAGISTGCRYCPNDEQCELQNVVDKIGLSDINYPVLYRALEAERMDPFFDRDYNICILCGRCVRMCQEMRGTGVLAFNWRGPKAIVGTAFGRNHIEAGCEFCGACISVCPTGALAEKASKWDGIPDGSIISTCPYCAIGCQLEMFHKDGRFSKAIPVLDPEVNDGQACLKGRFCLGEVSHHFERARKPMSWIGDWWREITWDEAIDKAAEKLKDVKPDEFAMLISPDCTNESLYAAQKFVRVALRTNSIDSTARLNLGGGLIFWANLFHKPISIQEITSSKNILAIGLDTRFNFSIIGVEMRKALQRGASLISINSRESNITSFAHRWIRPYPSQEGKVLKEFIKALDGKKFNLDEIKKSCISDSTQFEESLELLKNFENLTVIFGPRIFMYSDTTDLTDAITELSNRKNVSVVPLYYGTNTRGAMDLGVFPEILPGPVHRSDTKAVKKLESIWKAEMPTHDGITVEKIISNEHKLKVIYIVGSSPFFERPNCDFIIAQDIFEPDFPVDLYLPAASFFEESGTLVNMEGRVQEVRQIERLPDSVMYGRSRPDWWIFSQIAQKMGVDGFDYKSSVDILDEISEIADGFPKSGKITRRKDTFRTIEKLPKPAKVPANPRRKGRLMLLKQPAGYTHRGVDIRSKVEGLEILNPEDGFYLNPYDARSLGLTEGERITVKADGLKGVAVIRIDDKIPEGSIYLYVPQAYGGLKKYAHLKELFDLPENPCPVEVEKHVV